jgi:5'-AMP-activated protein kinase catalytic alpha subunit
VQLIVSQTVQVAIKILEKARIKDKKDIERISREIKILKKVRHPNVV